MTVQEQHIGIKIGVQKVHTNVNDIFQPEELDWLINEEVLRFIKTRVNKKSNPKLQGFQDTQKRYDDLEELITEATLPVYKKDSETVFTILPHDYFHLLEDSCVVGYDCKPITFTETVLTKRISIAEFKTGISGLYNSFKVELDNGTSTDTLIDIVDFPPYSSGLSADEERFVLINLVLEYVNRISGIEVRWENYNGKFYQNSFIFITDNPAYVSITITTDSIDTYAFADTTFTGFNHTLNTKTVNNRLIKTENKRELLDHPFGTTKTESPLSFIQRGLLNVYHNDKFIPDTIKIDYIRRPRMVDIKLNQSCEISPNRHEEINDGVAQRIIALINGDNYRNIINENLIKE